MSLRPDTIKAIFTNLLFVIGVILIIFGFSRGALTVANMIAFDKYPLQSYEETRCEAEYTAFIPLEPQIGGSTKPQISEEDRKVRYDKCITAVEHERSVRKVNDVVTSVSTLVSGSLVAFLFKRFIFK